MIPIWQERTISKCYRPIMKREKSFFFFEGIFNAALKASFLFLSALFLSPTKANFERQKSTFPSLPCSSLRDCAINDKVLNGKEKEKKRHCSEWWMPYKNICPCIASSFKTRQVRSLNKCKHSRDRQSFVTKIRFSLSISGNYMHTTTAVLLSDMILS